MRGKTSSAGALEHLGTSWNTDTIIKCCKKPHEQPTASNSIQRPNRGHNGVLFSCLQAGQLPKALVLLQCMMDERALYTLTSRSFSGMSCCTSRFLIQIATYDIERRAPQMSCEALCRTCSPMSSWCMHARCLDIKNTLVNQWLIW